MYSSSRPTLPPLWFQIRLKILLIALNPLTEHTIWFGVHQRQSDLFRTRIWLSAESISLLFSCNSWNILEGEEGLAFKVICPQGVVVQDSHDQATPFSLALIQGYQTIVLEETKNGSKHLESRRFTCERAVHKTSDLQFKDLVKKGVEITVFDLSAACFYLGKNVVRLQTQLHKRVAQTWQENQSTDSLGRLHSQRWRAFSDCLGNSGLTVRIHR